MYNYLSFLKQGSKIHIRESHKGKFTDYCNGKVTEECIEKGKHSPSAKIRKLATFAKNARTWKHQTGGRVFFNAIKNNKNSFEVQDPRKGIDSESQSSEQQSTTEQTHSSDNWWDNIFSSASTSLQTSTDLSESSTESNEETPVILSSSGKQVIDYLMNKHGLSQAAATGVAKVFQAESGLTPGIRNQEELERYGDDKAGIGIAQWSNGRRLTYRLYMDSHGYSNPTLENELDFFVEDGKTRPAFWQALNSAKDCKQAVDAMYYGYENGSNSAMATRDLIISRYTRAHRSLYGKEFNIDESLNRRYNASV